MVRHFRTTTQHANGASITASNLTLTVGALLAGEGLSGAPADYTVRVCKPDGTNAEDMDVTDVSLYPQVTVTRGINGTAQVAHDTTEIITQVVGRNDLDALWSAIAAGNAGAFSDLVITGTFTENYTPPAHPYAAAVLADSPIVYWRLGEASGTVASDSSGNGHSATYTGNATLGIAGPITDGNTAIGVAGDSLDYGGASLPLGSSDRTIEFWMKTTQTGIFDVLSYGVWTAGCLIVQYDRPNNRFALVFGNGAFLHYATCAAVNDGQWHHVVLVQTSAIGSSVMYVDTVASPYNSSASGFVPTAGPLSIGSGALDVHPNYTGDIDEVAIYGAALTGAKVANHYNANTGATIIQEVTTPTAGVVYTLDSLGNASYKGTVTAAGVLLGGGGGSGTVQLGYASATTSQTGNLSSTTDITSLSVTVTVPSGGVMVEVFLPLVDDTVSLSTFHPLLTIVDVTGSATIQEAFGLCVSGNGTHIYAKVKHSPGAGSRTYKAQIASVANDSTGRVFSASTAPAYIRVTAA